MPEQADWLALALVQDVRSAARCVFVAEIDRVQPGVAGAMPLEPAPHGAALAVLLVVTVLRPDELRRERDHLGMTRCHDRGAQQGVEELGRLSSSGAGRALR